MADTKIKPRNVPKRRPGPVGGKRDENRRRRTQELCDAGLELFLERGVQMVTIDEIVGQAGMAKGSFYRYFKDKTDLVDALFGPLASEVVAAFDACAQALSEATDRESLFAAYQLLGSQLGAALMQHPKAAQLYLQECRGPAVGARVPIRALADEVNAKALEITQVAREHELLRPFDTRISALSVVGAVEKLLFAVLSGEDVGNALEIPNALISLVLDGLRADEDDT